VINYPLVGLSNAFDPAWNLYHGHANLQQFEGWLNYQWLLMQL